MNKVLAAERMSQVQLVEARTKADVQKIESQSQGRSATQWRPRAAPRDISNGREYFPMALTFARSRRVEDNAALPSAH